MQIGQRVAVAGIAVSCVLAAAKIITGWLAHSTALLADGFESAGDVFASGLVLLGLIVAARPADENHPYGHGRAETLTGLFVGLILAAAGVGISFHSLQHAGQPDQLPAAFAVWPLIASIAIKSVLSGVKFHYGRQIRSAALVADAWNDFVDIASGAAALAAVTLTLYDPNRFLAADAYGGFAVGLIVIFTGIRVARDTGLQLMDTMPNVELMESVRKAASSVPGVLGVEKCYARKTGFQYHVDLHLEVDPDITVRDSHEIATKVRNHIRRNLNWVADVLVHVEPAPDKNVRLEI